METQPPGSAEDSVEWIVLTMGDRPGELAAAVASLSPARVCVVANGTDRPIELDGVRTLVEPDNLGVPGGRDRGARSSTAPVVGFLDDDAVASVGLTERVAAAFAADDRLGAIALRLIDDYGETSRRHVPRFGGRDAERGGDVALFLGGACAIRREAYLDADGYFVELFYGHEEVELAWRLIDRGWRIEYLPDLTVRHPRTEIGRHADGWRLTGRNRVLIARRTLPIPLGWLHAVLWLALGLWRAPDGTARRSYREGWWRGWSIAVERRPIGWLTVWRLTRLGRPPVL